MDPDHVELAHSRPGAPPASEVALIIDREPLVRELLRVVLSRQGWQVIEAATAREAAAGLNGHRPGLLVIDPAPSARTDAPASIDGDLIGEIRTRNPSAPIVVMSDNPQAEGIARALGARFMSKPFEVRDFVTFVASTTAALGPAGRAAPQNGQQATTVLQTNFRAAADALTAWRRAERRFEAAPQGSPERSLAESEINQCRMAYQHLVERRAHENEPGPSPGDLRTQRPSY